MSFEYFLGLNKENCNRSFYPQTPDQINTTVPVSLLMRMAELNIKPNYVEYVKNHLTFGHLSLDKLFNENSFFDFEATCSAPEILKYSPNITVADLYISDKENKSIGRPYEIKMAVIPDSNNNIAPELIIRPNTIDYLGASLCAHNFDLIKNKFVQKPIDVNWQDQNETIDVIPELRSFILEIASEMNNQLPFLYVPVWKTTAEGAPALNCFDAFFFSDAAFTYVIADNCNKNTNIIQRNHRSLIWLYLILREASEKGYYVSNQIFANHSYSFKNDKAFAMNGAKTAKYLPHENLISPRISWDDVGYMISDSVVATKPKRNFTETIQKYYYK